MRAIPLPDLPAAKGGDETAAKVDIEVLARHAAETGTAALEGKEGPARDSLIYAGAIALAHVGIEKNMQDAAAKIRNAVDSGDALAHFQQNRLD